MKQIETDAELLRLHRAGVGLIYNDFRGTGSGGDQFNVLHLASCNWIIKSNVNFSKISFDSISEATAWLEANRGPEGANWKRCGTCRPHGTKKEPYPITNAPPSMDGTLQNSNVLPPFTEGRVEDALIPWLERQGYIVSKRVRVSNGIIDIAASGSDGRWIIEAKGEDKGGYGSAEMNFQMGLGQIVSRMTEASANYALAIPHTPNFERVLRKFKGTIGFEKLGITLFIIKEVGTIQRIAPEDVSQFLETLL